MNVVKSTMYIVIYIIIDALFARKVFISICCKSIHVGENVNMAKELSKTETVTESLSSSINSALFGGKL